MGKYNVLPVLVELDPEDGVLFSLLLNLAFLPLIYAPPKE